jgi:UDP-N-acetylmuramate--alanine ligase
MIFSNIHIVYLIGIGGIGMTAIAQYFLLHNKKVAGYDCTPSDNTKMLETLGAEIHYDENTEFISNIVSKYKKDNILVIYTPAISQSSPLITWFKEKNIPLYKRAEVLGKICSQYQTIGVAGTHGKTTISSIIAHILFNSEYSCCAFLGGIIKNYNSNFLFNEYTKYAVVEADEFDYSFLQLSPIASVITSIDPDHLDIYKTYDKLKEAFQQYVNQIKPQGKLLIKKPIAFVPSSNHLQIATYSLNDKTADCYITDIKLNNSYFTFNIHTPWGILENITPEITGNYNIENVLAAVSITMWMGLNKETIKHAVESFKGIKRRFDVKVNNNKHIYIDDYAHHPEEIKALIQSVRTVFPNIPITGIFQPHLYSRTRDLANEFAQSLEMLDEICLLPIYPAREEPIKGVDSMLIFNKINSKNKYFISDELLLNWVKIKKPKLLITMGAGNIDHWVEPIKNILNEA